MAQTRPAQPIRQTIPAPHKIPLSLTVNGVERKLELAPWTTLLDALREHLNLTGTKKGCDQGSCGACTVHVDGRRVNACLTLAARCQGKAVTTIEGLARDGELHPMQAAFLSHDGLQCGYCTPGMILTAVDMVRRKGHELDDHTIREELEGNICRCTGYHNIVKAIAAGARAMRGSDAATKAAE